MAELIDRLRALDDGERKTFCGRTHPDYQRWHATWQTLVDAYDGSGGFHDGSYLWRFPRELSEKFGERRKQARYHNYVETLVDLYVRYIFAQPVVRTTTDPKLEAWWANVDGKGNDLTAFMRETLGASMAAAHAVVLVDRPAVVPSGPSRADERGLTPYAVRYTPVEATNWWEDGDRLIGLVVKVAAPQTAAGMVSGADPKDRWIVWDDTDLLVVAHDGSIVADAERAPHNNGRVPVAWMRPKRLERSLCGKPFVNASVIKALFNRASEEDEVLRNQAFSLFVVSVDKDADIEEAKRALGNDIGTTSALFVKGSADYRTPDQTVPAAIRENQSYLVREVWRMAHLRFERDSLAKESAEAIRLQNAELNQMLNGLAAECQRVEMELCRLYYLWTTPGAVEQADAKMEAAQVAITYPREFFATDLMTDLEAWAKAITFGLGDTMGKRIRKRVASRIDPDMDAETRQTVESEIDATAGTPDRAPVAGTSGALDADFLRQRAASRLAALTTTEGAA